MIPLVCRNLPAQHSVASHLHAGCRVGARAGSDRTGFRELLHIGGPEAEQPEPPGLRQMLDWATQS
jgi:hypothetical protein